MNYWLEKANFDPTGRGYYWYNFLILDTYSYNVIHKWCRDTLPVAAWTGNENRYLIRVQGEELLSLFILKWNK